MAWCFPQLSSCRYGPPASPPLSLLVHLSVTARHAQHLPHAAAGTYRVLPFSAAEFLVEVPYLAVQSTVYSVIVYW